jgi:PadR family transcriptional regulator PadR
MALLEDPAGQHWGYALSKSAGVRSGVLYPILARMLDEGWLTDGWENPAEITEQRPPRRYYRLTDDGRTSLGGILQRARTDARFQLVALTPRFAS